MFKKPFFLVVTTRSLSGVVAYSWMWSQLIPQPVRLSYVELYSCHRVLIDRCTIFLSFGIHTLVVVTQKLILSEVRELTARNMLREVMEELATLTPFNTRPCVLCEGSSICRTDDPAVQCGVAMNTDFIQRT